ncbi:MAG: (deoxy)nucleoside triphosphate pyrophosphohydrolase [Pseudomonadales bacterium]|nr:(deoxy)nucleoside triphosphate pyrophosphohydrolase [Pseudomonadales bacterium]
MDRIIRVVAGMVLRDGDVLLARRGPGMTLAGHWEFPGGKLEPGEGPAEALVRELDEELGIRVRPVAELAVSELAQGDRRIRLEGWLAELLAGEPEAREHDALLWRAPHAVEEAGLAPADLPLLEALRRRCEGGTLP